MTSQIELLYFQGCPNFIRAKALLDRERISYVLIDLNLLPAHDSKRSYSSPSILASGKLIYGSRINVESSACSISFWNEEEVISKIKSSSDLKCQ